MPMFVPDYNGLHIHKEMLRDTARTEAYIAALEKVVPAGAVVVDFGAGTGILSLAAARAGACRVYAFERAKVAELAKRNFAANFPDGRIELIMGDVRDYSGGRHFADVLVSEWLGVHAFQENMLSTFIIARDWLLRQPAILIPHRVGLWLAPLRTNKQRRREIDDWKQPYLGFDLSAVASLSLDDPYNFTVDPAALVGKGEEVLVLDMNQVEDCRSYLMRGSFVSSEDEVVEAICGWFVADLAAQVCLDTSPFQTRTHWEQAIYPFAEPIQVAAGETLLLEVDAEPREGYCEFSWRGCVAEREAETLREQSTKSNYLIPR